MKKRILLPAAAAMLIFALSACGTDGKQSSDTGTAQSGGQPAVQTIQGQTQAAAEEEEGAAPEEEPDEPVDIWEEENYEDDDPDGTGGQDEGDAADEDGTGSVIEDPEEEMPQAEGGWHGAYLCENNGESLLVNLSDDGAQVQFTFENAGIAGTADLNGNTAVYHGDDQADVVFSLSGETITVSVQSQEDYGEINSVVNGTYGFANP